MESYVHKIIPLAGISREFPFACRYALKDPLLWNSVAQRGVLKPVVVSAQKQMISGHKRLLAAETAGLKDIPVFEISENRNPADLYLLAVFSNWNQALSDLDRAWAIERAVSSFKLDEQTVLDDIFPALGLEPQKHFLEEARETAALDPSVLEAISTGQLPFRGARILARFSKSDQSDFVKAVISRAALTSNQLLRAGEWLYDLVKLKGIPLPALLKSAGFEVFLDTPSQDRRQRGEKFCAALRALRFPELVRKEKEFESLAAKIEADQGFSLEPPSYFEGEGLTLRAKLPNLQALDKLAGVLERKRKLFNSLFDIML